MRVAMQMLLAVLLILSGCASIINGTTQEVSISTTPQGATVKTTDNAACITPCKLELARKQDHILNINKKGYEETNLTLQHVISGAVAGNIILGGLIGWGIDAASGAQYRLVPETVNVDLKPFGGGTKEKTLAEKIAELDNLKESGKVTDDEYKKAKERIIDSLK